MISSFALWLTNTAKKLSHLNLCVDAGEVLEHEVCHLDPREELQLVHVTGHDDLEVGERLCTPQTPYRQGEV